MANNPTNQNQLKSYNLTLDRLAYGGRIGLSTGAGYVIGKVGSTILLITGEGLDRLLDLHYDVVRGAAKADEKATEIVKTIPGGETALGLDEKMNNIWGRIFGRTPEKQREWRQRYGIEPKSETSVEAPSQQQYSSGTQQPSAPQEPSHFYRDKLDGYGDVFVNLALLAGLVHGVAKGAFRYLDAKGRAALINAQRIASHEYTRMRESSAILENAVRELIETLKTKP
ncbi:hypothetical protein HY637_02960 [Candidatus Woesearchaeota archaeon]|nr:hypothetical protein [Candidatus Woesearchaeota archaeon]